MQRLDKTVWIEMFLSTGDKMVSLHEYEGLKAYNNRASRFVLRAYNLAPTHTRAQAELRVMNDAFATSNTTK